MNILIPANQIIKKPYPLWNKYWKKLLSRQETFLLKSLISSEPPEDDLVKHVKALYQLEDYPQLLGELSPKIENSIVLDFEGKETFITEISKVRKIGFIGFNDDFEKKIERYAEMEFDAIISELMPDEIPTNLSSHTMDFFFSRHYFLPPQSVSFKIIESDSPKILFLKDSYYHNSNQRDQKLLDIIDLVDSFEILSVNELEKKSHNICASSIVFAGINPQYKHSLRLSSKIPVSELNQGLSYESPLRNIFFDSNYLCHDLIFHQEPNSLRHKINQIIKNKKSQDLKGVEIEEKEFSNLLFFLEHGKTEDRRRFHAADTTFRSLEKNDESKYPLWFFHPATEPYLRQLVRQIKEKGLDIPDSQLVEFIFDAFFTVQLLDFNNLFFADFLTLFDINSKEVLERFHDLACKACKSFGQKVPEGSGLHAKISYKLAKQNFRSSFASQHPNFDQKTANTLIEFISLGQKLYQDSLTDKMYTLSLLILSNQDAKAYKFTKLQKTQSDINILCIYSALCFGLLGNAGACRESLSLYKHMDSQYGKDFTSIAYLLANFLSGDMIASQAPKILDDYKLRKPSKAWWESDFVVLAILKVIPRELSPELFCDCEKYATTKLGFFPQQVDEFSIKQVELNQDSSQLLKLTVGLLH